MPSRQPRDTRHELVEIGVAALLELTPAALLSAVGIKEIARRAGVGAPALYHHFGSLDAFAEAVVARVYDPSRFAVHEVTGSIGDLARGELPAEATKAFHRRDFERLRQDPLFRVRLGLWALGGHSVDVPYGDLLRTIDVRIAAAAGALFEGWRRELRPPADLPTYVAIQTAMISGSVVRHLVDPAAMDADRFSRLSSALAIPLLRAKGDQRNLDDRLTELNTYLRRAGPHRVATGAGALAAAKILDAAEEVFERHGYDQASVAQVARTAGVSTSTLYHHYAGLPEVAISLITRRFRARQPDDAPLEGKSAAHDDVRSLLVEIGEFCAARIDHLAPYAAYLALGPDADDPLVASVAQRLPGRTGLAGSMLLLLVSSLVTAPSQGAAGAADRAMMLIGHEPDDDGEEDTGP